jgi:Uma2 family endonuclease
MTHTSTAITDEHPPSPVSYEDFLAWAHEDTRAEWVDGEIILMSPNSPEHQKPSNFLTRALSDYVEAHDLGHVYPPVIMRLRHRPSGREPDIVFLTNEHATRERATDLDGPADLAVEIVSPDSVVRDHQVKLAEYEVAGVREYWIIDPLRATSFFYQLGDDDRYRAVGLDADGVYYSAVVPGFWLREAWLWQRPLPKMADIRRQLGL